MRSETLNSVSSPKRETILDSKIIYSFAIEASHIVSRFGDDERQRRLNSVSSLKVETILDSNKFIKSA